MMRFTYNAAPARDLTHGLFRYPAKFHPGIAQALIAEHSRRGDLILDPFCGSGTLLVEACTAGVHSIGTDIDPLAVFISAAKSSPINPEEFGAARATLLKQLLRYQLRRDYTKLSRTDIGNSAFNLEIKPLSRWVPPIPHMYHWFRKYAVVDLARIRKTVSTMKASTEVKRALLLCFSGIIRNASNADPVPVSGLEYTAHMRRLDASGRVVDPFELFFKKLEIAELAYERLWAKVDHETNSRAMLADARSLTAAQIGHRFPDVIITSPPYIGAVDYYRRHQLEMFWLGLVQGQKDRMELIGGYIGRPKVYRVQHASADLGAEVIHQLLHRLPQDKPMLVKSVIDYSVSLNRVFASLASITRVGARCVFVVGEGKIGGMPFPIEEAFASLAAPYFRLASLQWFETQNKYMSYKRRNGANINKEYVLCFERCK